MRQVELIYGDCLKKMSDIPDGSIDMVLADPPYGITKCKWDSVIPLESMWEQLKRVTKLNGPIILTAGQPFTTRLIISNIKMFKYELIWDKVCPSGALLAYKRIMKVHENICLFYRKQCTYNPQYTKRKKEALRPNKVKTKLLNPGKSWEGGNKKLINKHSDKYDDTRVNPKSILTFNRRTPNIVHPTQKPVAFMEYLIKTFSNEGETVLDFCMGSGTTGVACKNLERRFIGIEIDKEYFDIAKQRIGKAGIERTETSCKNADLFFDRFLNERKIKRREK